LFLLEGRDLLLPAFFALAAVWWAAEFSPHGRKMIHDK